ncbi:toxin glutamine deamidase domain-containing protein [Streptomyces sp. NPDC007110]|uniref:toxin glutamine deamidase domain-containing protein n=1 Tax=Streptomyces sp. NPDC007110 TaxID=3156916 RepID=UPI0033F2D0A5
MMLPDELEWVLEMLGYRWPTADEDKLRDCAEVWRQFGEKVTELHGTANGAARQVTAHNAGESIDKFVKTYGKFDGGGGGDGYLRNAAEAAFLIANVLEACAYLVEFAKWAVIAQLIALAIEIVAAHAAAPFTFGLSEVAGLGATQVTRLIVRRLLDELKKALLEAIVETMKEPAISAIEAIITDLVRQTVNVGFGAQEGYDVGATLKAGGTAGLDALKQSPQTFAEGVRDSLGQKAGSRARHAIDSRIDGYDGASGLPSGEVGSDPGSDSGSRSSSSSSDSPSSNSSSSNSDGNSGTSSSDSNGSDSSTSTRSGNGNNLPGTNIGNGISADTGGNNIGGPNVGAGPDSGSGPGSDSSGPSSSDTPYSRPAQSPSDSSLSDFDDPSPGGRSPSGSDSPASSSGTPSTSGPPHSGGSPVSGLSSPSPQAAPTHASSSSPSSSPSGGSIGTQIDSLAATAPTQSNAAPTPAAADTSSAGSGGRPDGGSGGMPTSPTAASPAGTTPASSHTSGGPSGGSTSPTSPNANSGPARNPSASTPGTAPAAGTGPASTPRPTSPTAPRSTPTADGRVPGTGDSRAPGTPDGRIPAQRPGGTPTGDAGTTPRNTPGTPRGNTPGSPTTAGDGNTPRPRPTTATPNDGTTSRTNPSTTPNDSSTPRNTPGSRPSDTSTPRNNPSTTPGDNSASRNNPGTTPNDRGDRTPPRTTTPGNPSTTPRSDSTPPRSTPDQPGSSRTPTPGQNPAQSTPSRATPPSTASPATSTPGGSTPHSPSTSPGPAPHNTPSQGTPGTPNQPGTGTTPSRPPQQPAGSTPNQPGPQTQQPPASTPNHQQQPQVTPVPIHHVTTAPSGQPTPAAPHHSDPGPTTPNQSNPSDSPKPREVPTPASETRNTNPPGGVTDPTRAEQDALENSVPRDENGDPTRPPDPADGPWVQHINGDGPDAPGRSNNCVDTALSTVDTYAGNPTAAGARTPDLDADGNPSDRGERGGRDRIENTLGARFSDLGNGRDAFNRLENTLRDSGHGSQAVIITQDANGRAHAWNAVNHNGKITYIDAQTGQQSRNPLHSGDHGVFSIPLDPNRQPVTLEGTRGDGRSTPDYNRQTPEAADHTDRRPSEAPAGAPQHSDGDGTDEKPHPRDDPQRSEHPRLTEPETVDSTHYGMNPMPDQQNVRQTNNVRQLDMDPVHQQLNDWLDPIPNEDGSGTRVPLVDALQSCSPPRPDDPDHEPRILRHDDLAQILPGFADMHPGERGAVIASLARLSLRFHASHAVSASPEPLDGYPNPAVAKHAGAKWAPSRRDDEITAALIEDLGGVAASINNAGDHRPDFTGRNYAAVEVYDPISRQISYVVDSSYPGADNKHSEKNILDYLETLNKQREEGSRYEPLSMYTDREPCGKGVGYANCARLISRDMSGVDVFYGTGYRKEAEIVSPEDIPEKGKTHKQQFEDDLVGNLKELGKVWIRAMRDGGLQDAADTE